MRLTIPRNLPISKTLERAFFSSAWSLSPWRRRLQPRLYRSHDKGTRLFPWRIHGFSRLRVIPSVSSTRLRTACKRSHAVRKRLQTLDCHPFDTTLLPIQSDVLHRFLKVFWGWWTFDRVPRALWGVEQLGLGAKFRVGVQFMIVLAPASLTSVPSVVGIAGMALSLDCLVELRGISTYPNCTILLRYDCHRRTPLYS